MEHVDEVLKERYDAAEGTPLMVMMSMATMLMAMLTDNDD
jgi:hypothetical protein